MDFSIIKDSVLHSRRTFRTPFKVTSMCFSPQNDLIALGSKTGEVLMKRTSWKIIWKTNMSMVPAVGTECKSESSITALHFSPDGRYIAAATSKGILHLLDVETGKTRYSVKVSTDQITRLHWESIQETNPTSNLYDNLAEETRNSPNVEDTVQFARSEPELSREDIGLVYADLDEEGTVYKHDEAQKESLEKMVISGDAFRESLRNTVLLAAVDDTRISVLIAGVFPYMEIDINEVTQQHGQDMVLFYDMHYSAAFGGVSLLVTTYGPFLDCKQQELKPPGGQPKADGNACHTLVFNVKLEIDNSLWEAARRYVRLLYGYNMFSIAFDTTKRNWEQQITGLHNRFDTKTKAVKIGDVLLEMLLSGSTDMAGEAFLERSLGVDGLQGIRDFTEKHMTEVCRLARGQLASSARNLSFQRCEFSSALERSDRYTRLNDDDEFLYEDEPSLGPSSVNRWLAELEEKVALLDTKVHQLGGQCLIMMQELGHLTKWISLTKPFAKTMKVNSLVKIKRMDIANILFYIVANFIPESELSKSISKRLFKLKEVSEEQEKTDKENKFDEVDFLISLENAAEDERVQLMELYHKKFKFSALSDENEDRTDLDDSDNSSGSGRLSSAMDTTNPPPTVVEEESTGQTVDLDRVGSFFGAELSEKALEVLPACSETFDNVVNKAGIRMNSDGIKNIGLLKAVENLSKILSSPQKMHDASGKKPQVQFVYEIASDSTHQGFLDAKISDVTASNFRDLQFDTLVGMSRSMQVSAIEKNSLKTVVLVPTRDVSVEQQRETEIGGHVEGMRRFYKFEKLEVGGTDTVQVEEAMEVDDNELRIEVDIDHLNPQFNTLVNYDRVFPLRHGELVLVGKFTSSQEGSGVMPRVMRTVSSYPHRVAAEKDVFAVHASDDGKGDVVIETMIVHPTTQLTAFLHEDGAKITICDLKPGEPEVSVEQANKKTGLKTFRDYQRRRERYREGIGSSSLQDIQYDVYVQDAMDSGRDPNVVGDDEEEDD